MANKKIQRNKAAAAAQAEANAGSLWLAGVGAISIARKQGGALLRDLIAEGRRLQGDAVKVLNEARADARAQVAGFLTPVKAQFRSQAGRAGKAVETGVAGVLARLGIPSKADIDELAQRVAALTRQLKSTK